MFIDNVNLRGSCGKSEQPEICDYDNVQAYTPNCTTAIPEPLTPEQIIKKNIESDISQHLHLLSILEARKKFLKQNPTFAVMLAEWESFDNA